ncbi:phosphate ABC transporter ATP-binding protein [Pseudobacteriovorax antillogorgiicola]|uniref:Phosphate ABC transporter ATP-binding protein, PhoT family n=1 Tax=Pseudobacteriovorax antillogorgiicola TaxID=1513793 RepID=A0A1Y6CR18_9BACT|nr:phosphate ABC transporter ATP-binding protein [Pseudobacteriovorax antillogorgiicola]TCS46703.1 phosphate ABC transporter ATP-binding protein (PhoT family) [Pseudobacteriovorax antillogorgiicola]SMF66907.1 phosphate ABC transporter ATP-binding protein, PhoT family [Pseudobacteriovorax antillogorgiicola]
MAIEIDVKNLSMAYGQQSVFQNISASFEKNTINAIIGPSGCGKSSFVSCLNLLSRSFPDARVSGDIFWNQKNLNQDDVELKQVRRKIGMLFQQATPFPNSIRKNLLIPLQEHFKLSKEEQNQALESALSQVGLWDEVKDRLNRSALDLSGGQKQRLCLARALILEPEVILMDEPCSALDPLATQTIEALIKKIKSRVTVIMVTHNMAQARRIADHVTLFWHKEQIGGYIDATGPAHQMFEDPPTETAQKYVQGLMG